MTENSSRTALSRALARGAGLAALGALAIARPALAADPLPLMPLPQSVERQDGVLRLGGLLAPTVTGCAADFVPGAVARFGRDLVSLAGAPLANGAPVSLTIRCLAHDPGNLSVDAREGYRLTVGATGVAVEADGETGVLRALATLRQLVGRDAQGPSIPAVRISDAPRFAWRGLMLDTARHFISVPTVKRQIDAMELAKLNVLHFHLADNEGFRVESRLFPKLTTVASHGEYYTQAEVRDLVRYAAERGVRIVPEFDMPGHSYALLTAYPEYAVAPIDPKDPLAKQKGVLDPSSEKTYRFLEKFLGEMTALFPDRQFHVGGDEVSDVAWKDSPAVEALKRKHGLTTKLQVEGWFHARVRKILAARGKTTIGWDEMAEEPLPQDVIVHAWRSSNPISTATAKGHRVIVSAGFYINNLHSAERHYGIDLLDPVAAQTMSAEELEATRKNPVTAAQVSDGLVARPMPPLTPEQAKLVIGGEGALWAEMITDEMVDGRAWPRALSLGEQFWSAASVRDADSMYARLVPAMEGLRALGLQDERLRDRMIARLAPGDTEVVRRVIGYVAPAALVVGHLGTMTSGKEPEFVELVDIASTDPSPARRFRTHVAAYLAGDKTRGALLRGEMKSWIDNAPAFARVAAGRPMLQKAVPTVQDLADLGELGLAALDAVEQGKPLAAAQARAGRDLVDKIRDYVAGSADFGSIMKYKQPPGALLILTAPDVGRLLDAAQAPGRK